METKKTKNRIISLFVILCMVVSVCSVGLEGTAVFGAEKQSQEIRGDYAEDQIIVVFEDDVNKKEAAKIVDKKDGEDLTLLDTPQDEITAVVELPKDQTVEEAVSLYEHDAKVAYAQPNYRYRLADDESIITEDGVGMQQKAATAASKDPYASQLWHLDTVQAEKAWKLIQNVPHKQTRVLVLDTGVDTKHPDLQATLNKSLCLDTSYGVRKPLNGDDDGHGTHVAGIIGATANNNIGVAGVASGTDNSHVELVAVDMYRWSTKDDHVETKGNYAFTDGIFLALGYAVELNADVINLSMGLDGMDEQTDRALRERLEAAYQSGAAIVCSAGNDHSTANQYPSDYERCIGVIATDQNNKRTSFSNYGPQKDLSAPGQSIVSTYPTAITSSGYKTLSGTSMAAPVVSGAAALLYSVDASMTPDRARELLCSTATDIYARGRDSDSGYGIVNAYRAASKLLSTDYVVELRLNKNQVTLNRGRSIALTASVVGTDYRGISWSSSDPSVASVDAAGRVTAQRGGRVTITAKSKDLVGASDSCQVTIPYTITYYLNGGKNSLANPSGYYGSVTLKNPTRKGYTFAGWYKDSGYKARVVTFSGGDQTLYAKWTKVKAGRTSIKKLRQTAKTKLKVSYKKISGAKGYQITYSTSKKFSKKTTKTIYSKSTAKTLSKLKKGKKYYVKVRAYKLDSTGERVYGKYSKVKRLKLKR